MSSEYPIPAGSKLIKLSPPDLVDMPFADKVYEWVSIVFGGEHHLVRLENKGHYYLCIPRGTLATFDDDRLTRIVLASHRYGLRAEIDNHGMRGLKILLHNRPSRNGRMWERHPTIEQAIQLILGLD